MKTFSIRFLLVLSAIGLSGANAEAMLSLSIRRLAQRSVPSPSALARFCTQVRVDPKTMPFEINTITGPQSSGQKNRGSSGDSFTFWSCSILSGAFVGYVLHNNKDKGKIKEDLKRVESQANNSRDQLEDMMTNWDNDFVALLDGKYAPRTSFLHLYKEHVSVKERVEVLEKAIAEQKTNHA